MKEYVLLFIEYHVIKKWGFVKNTIIPTLAGICVYLYAKNNFLTNPSEICNNITNIIGILIGFSISVFAILLSVENDNIRDAKKEMLDVILYAKPVSLFESLLIDYAYIIILQGIILIVNLIIPFLFRPNLTASKIFISVDIASVVYVIVLILRCVLDMYFILTKKSNNYSHFTNDK